MVAAGADVVDVGGGSTRTGVESVPVAEERERVVPVIERLAGLDAAVSVDTREPTVAGAALDAGADVLNDGTGLGDARMRRLVAERAVPVVLAHSFDTPGDPDTGAGYDDAVDEVLEELTERLLLAERAGIDRSRVIVDTGLGLEGGSSGSDDRLDRLPEFQALGTPVLVDHSSGSSIGDVTSEEAGRLATTVATTALAAERGADIVRVRDVAGNVAAVSAAERAVCRTRPIGHGE
jgi:dihydropteroate synthase